MTDGGSKHIAKNSDVSGRVVSSGLFAAACTRPASAQQWSGCQAMPLHVLSSSLHLLFCLALFRKGFQSTVNGKRAPSRCARRKGGRPSWPHSKRNNCYLRRGKKTVSRDLHHTAIISVMFNVSNNSIEC